MATAATQHQEPDHEEEEDDEGLDTFFARHEPPPFPLPSFDEPEPEPTTTAADSPKIELRQDSRSALGGRVWRASLFLLRWLRHRHGPTALADTAVLDVGAGIGMLGLACAGARLAPRLVVLTDQDYLLPLLEENAGCVQVGLAGRDASSSSNSVRVSVQRLDWLERGQGADTAAVAAAAGPGGFDWILVADCVYYQHLFAPLVATLAALATEAARVVICNDDGRTSAAGVEAATGERWDAEFFRLLAGEFEWDGDEVYPVGEALGLEGGPYRVVVCRRRRKI